MTGEPMPSGSPAAVAPARRALVLLSGLLLAAVLVGSSAAHASPCDVGTRTIRWTGAGDGVHWDVAGNWLDETSTARVPTIGDQVCIAGTGSAVVHRFGDTQVAAVSSDRAISLTGGTLDLAADSNVSVLNQSGGVLTGGGTVVVEEQLAWTAGRQAGSGRTVLLATAGATVGSTSSVTLDARTLIAAGAVTQSGTLWLQNAALLDSGGIWAMAGAVNVYESSGGGTLVSTGTLTKTGAGAAVLAAPLRSTGTVSAVAGTLTLQGGDDGGPTTGQLSGEGGVLRIRSVGFTFGDGTALRGVELESGTHTVAGSVTGRDLVQAGGEITGVGTLTLEGTSAWTHGTQSGAGQTVLAADATLTVGVASGSVTLDRRHLRIDGAVTQAGTVYARETATVVNEGAWTLTGDAAIEDWFGLGEPLLSGGGTFAKEDAGTSRMSVPVSVSGSLTAMDGRIALSGSAAAAVPSTGSFTATGAGRVTSGGALSLGGGATLQGVEVTGGTVTVHGAVGAADLEQTGGTVTGPGTLTVSGTSAWEFGTHSGSGRTAVAAGATLALSAPIASITLEDRTLVNHGHVAQHGTGYLRSVAQVDNVGTWTLHGTAQLQDWSGLGEPLFASTGVLAKAGAGTATMAVPLRTTGVVSAPEGVMRLTGADGGVSAGRLSASGDGSLVLAGTYAFADGTVWDGVEVQSGTVTLVGGVDAADMLQSGGTITGSGTLTIAGASTWSSGTQRGPGLSAVAAGGSLDLSTPVSQVTLWDRTLANHGSVAQRGSAYLRGDAGIHNTGTFAVHGTSSMHDWTGTSQLLLDNAGTLTKVGAGTATISIPVRTRGVVSAPEGVLRLRGAAAEGTSTGLLSASGGGSLLLATDLTFGDGTTLDGAEVEGGTITLAGAITGHDVSQTGGTMTGPGTFTVTGASQWRGGIQQGPGETVVAPGASLVVSDPSSSMTLWDRVLRNEGTVTQRGTAYQRDDAQVDNAGTWTMAGSAGWSSWSGLGDQLFTNSGTLAKSDAGAASISIPWRSTGAVAATAGTLTLSGRADESPSTGSLTATSPGEVLLSGPLTLGGGTALAGVEIRGEVVLEGAVTAADLTQSSGGITGPGSLRLAGASTWSGGTQGGTGRTTVSRGAVLSVGSGQLDGRLLVNAGTVAVTGSLSVHSGASIDNGGTLELIDTATLWGGQAPALVLNRGLLMHSGAGDGAVHSSLDNDGTVRADEGRLSVTNLMNMSSTGGVLTGGRWEVAAGAAMALPEVEVLAATLVVEGATAEISTSWGTAALGRLRRVTSAGRLALQDGATVASTEPLRNAGTVELGSGCGLHAEGGYTQAAGRTALHDANARLSVGVGQTVDVTGGTLTGVGTVDGDVAATGGRVAPGGQDPGTITINGSYAQGPGGRLHTRVGSAGNDMLAVAGHADLDGALRVAYLPSADGSGLAVVLEATEIVGTFGTFDPVDVPAGSTAALSYSATQATVTLTPPAAPSGPSVQPEEPSTGGEPPPGDTPDGDPKSTAPTESGPVVEVVPGDEHVATALALSTSRFATAETADAAFAGVTRRAGHVVLARDDDFADALAGTSLSADGPLLFTPSARLPDAVRAELRRVLGKGGTVYLLGGEAALSPTVEETLVADGHEVVRLAGGSRIETALRVADVVRRRAPAGTQALVARAFGTEASPTAAWADSVSVGGWAAATGTPVLLTATESLHPAVAGWLARDETRRTIAVGGRAALSDAVVAALPGVVRTAGADRFQTAARIATDLWPAGGPGRRYTVVSGVHHDGWAYGLAAAGLSADRSAPLLLVHSSVPAATVEAAGCDADGFTVVGGDAVVPAGVLDELEGLTRHC